MNDLARQDVICVLGMHRSGTSLLTRIINLLGVDLGAEQALTTEPASDNPKGYWEHNQMVSISDAILKRYGGTWFEPPFLPVGWETSPGIEDLNLRAQELIHNQFAGAPLWAWKDPRCCLTLPFWQSMLPEMRYLICLRNPAEVALSLNHRDNLSAAQGSRLWFTYVSAALRHTEGKPRLVVFYEDLMADCLAEISRLTRFLGTPVCTPNIQSEVSEFVTRDLRHHQITSVQAVEDPEIDSAATMIYLAQRGLRIAGREHTSAQRDEEIQTAFDALNQQLATGSGKTNQLSATFNPTEDTSRWSPANSASANEVAEQLMKQIDEQAQDLSSKNDHIQTLSSRLCDAEMQIRFMQDTWVGRMLSRYLRRKST